ncbi:MAG: M20/M25/M40 family metallo-hydrolase, partial [Anaerolineales bacterium]
QLTPTLRGMHFDSDGLNERAGLSVGFRLPSHLSPITLDENIRKVVGDQARVRARRGAVPAYRAAKNNALVRAALASIRAEGGEPGFVLKSGTSDMNLVAPVWGCPAIAYGPGDSSLDHTPHERISIAEYLQSIRVLQRILKRLAGEGG